MSSGSVATVPVEVIDDPDSDVLSLRDQLRDLLPILDLRSAPVPAIPSQLPNLPGIRNGPATGKGMLASVKS